MDQATISRYQPGGDIYASLVSQYGTTGANIIATAARTGNRGNVTEAISQVKDGPFLPTSTAEIFATQITTDPFAAPFKSLNSGLSTIFGSAIANVFANPWVLLLLVGLVFYFLGGFKYILKHPKLN